MALPVGSERDASRGAAMKSFEDTDALARSTLYDPAPGFQLLPDFGS
jgi:hypothetical protein